MCTRPEATPDECVGVVSMRETSPSWARSEQVDAESTLVILSDFIGLRTYSSRAGLDQGNFRQTQITAVPDKSAEPGRASRMLRDLRKNPRDDVTPAPRGMNPGEFRQRLSGGSDSDWSSAGPSALGQADSIEVE